VGREVAMDFPAGWAFVRGTLPESHDVRCSWRVTTGVLLCDCRVLWDEYDRRRAALVHEEARRGT